MPGPATKLNLVWKELSYITEYIQSRYMDLSPPKPFISQSHEAYARRHSGKIECVASFNPKATP